MDYEKRYKEALEKARQLCAYPTTKPFISDLQDLFPELEESDGEMIRKDMIETIKKEAHEFPSSVIAAKSNSWIAWLEKQGEQKPILDVEIPFGAKESELEEVSYNIPNGYHAEIDGDEVVIKKGEKKPAEWSGEDSPYFDDICELLMNILYSEGQNYNMEAIKKDLEWFKSLKERVQPKQEWSKQDEMMIKFALTYFRKAGATEDSDIIKWLKSLKERQTWKPSDEQIIALRWVLNNVSYNKHKEEISGLLEQIKDL